MVVIDVAKIHYNILNVTQMEKNTLFSSENPLLAVFQHKLSCGLEVQAKSIKMLDILQYIKNNVIIMKYKHSPY